ncbi:ThuA domain-containing protein, partial [bacterium]|nr:ThuA domain-containing protein [bacterium]
DGKPWNQEVRINIEEPDHPLLRPFKGEPFAVREEIFKFRDYDRTSARILMSLNDGGIDIQRGGRDDRDYATCWIRNWGDGRVYYSVHGHHAEVFEKTNFQEHVKLSMQWAIGDLQVDTAPSPALDREAIGAKALQSLRLATTADDRVAALHTLAWCPVEGALDLVVPLFKEDRRVASVAAEAAKALCENEKYLSKDRRVEILLAAFPLCSDAGVRKSIREGLQRLGVKDIPAAYSPGYLFIWWVAGPISGDPDEVRRKVFPPEKKVDIERGFDVDGAHYAWRMAIANEDGILDLVEVFDSQANCAIYMYGEALVEKEQDVELRFGSDDGFVAWLNGAEVSRFDGHRALRPGSEKAKVRLKAGANQILMKIDQKNGDWAGCAQIVGLDGKEADFTERTK